MHHSSKTVMSNIMLIIAAGVWGSSIVFAKTTTGIIGPSTFMAARYFCGTISMIFIILFMETRRIKKEKVTGVKNCLYDKAYFARLFKIAPLCSLANLFGNILVQMGLACTTASKTGFLNSIYIIFVPVMGFLFFRKKSGINIYVGLLLAVIGLYNLCMTESLTIEKGDLIILSSTLFFALHIQLVAKYVHELQGIHFSCVEFGFATIVCGILGYIFEEPAVEQFIICAPTILYAGVLGIGLCYALQVTAQKYTDPTVASLLMSLESVFSAVLGVLLLGESFTSKEIIGIIFIIAAVIIAQLPDKLVDRITAKLKR